MVPWSHWRQPSSGWMMTVLTSEFTHFNLVIHLSKLQQLALLFSSLFRVVPLFLLSQGPQCCVLSREAIPNVLKPPFFAATLQHRCIKSRHMNQAGTRLSGVVSVSFWLSGEVKHIVNLIRWTLEAVYALVADWNTVPVQGTIARHLGI